MAAHESFRVGNRVSLDRHLRTLHPGLPPAGVVVAAEPVDGLVPVRPDGCATTFYFAPGHLRRLPGGAPIAKPGTPHAPAPRPPRRPFWRPRARTGRGWRWKR